MKKSILYIIICCLTVGLMVSMFLQSKMGEYISRHIKNYNAGHIISIELNPNMPGRARVYDAEDFRAGAFDACSVVQKYYGEDLCSQAGYWGILGPRITIEQAASAFDDLFGPIQ